MTSNGEEVVPVWTLTTGDMTIPEVVFDKPITPQRLNDLRAALAALAEQPIATLEVHPVPTSLDRTTSPLAQHLNQLISNTSAGSHAVVPISQTGEMLYRMVVPAKFAGALSKGIIQPMQSKVVTDGIRGSLVGASGIVANSSFVPVAEASAIGAVAGSAGTAGAAVVGGTALTVAAPLVLMAVAVAITFVTDAMSKIVLTSATIGTGRATLFPKATSAAHLS